MGIDINISRVDNGYVVHAGCMTLAFNNRAELAVELTRWLENPAKVEQEYIDKYRGSADGAHQLRNMVGEERNARAYETGRGAGFAMPTDTPTRERLRGEGDVARDPHART